MPPTLPQIEAARARIRGAAIRTPLVRLNIDDAPAEIYLKLENLQPIGSFKLRGAANAMAQLSPDQLARGVLTASTGNMAQGTAWMARRLGVACTVVAPVTAPAIKLAAIERLGGRVIKVPFERWWQTFQERAYPNVDATFIHAFDDPAVIAGNGTIGLEILEDLPDVAAIVIPWGGGGLACGGLARGRVRDLLPFGPPGERVPDAVEQQCAGLVLVGHAHQVDVGDDAEQPVDLAVLDPHGY